MINHRCHSQSVSYISNFATKDKKRRSCIYCWKERRTYIFSFSVYTIAHQSKKNRHIRLRQQEKKHIHHSMATELGKTYPCFGEFQCPRCRKKWQSSKAWADYGQECKSCSIKVMPSELQKLFVYICSYCQAKWNWAYKPRGLKCKRCSSSILVLPLDRENYQDRQYIKAHTLRELNHDDNENHINPNKEHREDLCEKCQKLGRPCHQTAGQDYRIFPNQTSFAVSLYFIYYSKRFPLIDKSYEFELD